MLTTIVCAVIVGLAASLVIAVAVGKLTGSNERLGPGVDEDHLDDE